MLETKKELNDFLSELKKHPSVQVFLNEETTLTEKLVKLGLSPKELASFLKKNLESNRAILDVKKNSMEPEDFWREKTELNKIEMIIHYLEDSI